MNIYIRPAEGMYVYYHIYCTCYTCCDKRVTNTTIALVVLTGVGADLH